jgi:heme A synthase
MRTASATPVDATQKAWQTSRVMTSGSVAEGELRLERSPATATTLARWYAGTLVYTLFVVLFGAVVRITGSGAGCGQHWPTCQGQIAHLPRSVETAIELGHRVTSGISFLLVVGLALATFSRLPGDHPARRFAALSALFMIVEVLIGAVLVLRRLVEHDGSVERAILGSAHLVNTCLLTGSLLVAMLAASGNIPQGARPSRRALLAMTLGGAAILIVCVSGAVTALGDTVHPIAPGTPLADRVFAEQSSAVHFLVRLRALHPLLAVLSAAALLVLSPVLARLGGSAASVRYGRLVALLLVAQTAAGTVNVLASAPAWMQILHLGLASAIWLAWVLLSASTVGAPREGALGAGTSRAGSG